MQSSDALADDADAIGQSNRTSEKRAGKWQLDERAERPPDQALLALTRHELG